MRGQVYGGAGLIAYLLFLSGARAEGPHFESAGVRNGFSHTGQRYEFRQSEAFVSWTLPWTAAFGDDWSLGTRLQASAGWLSRAETGGFVGTLGPAAVLERRGCPLAVVAGVSPTWISRHTFPHVDDERVVSEDPTDYVYYPDGSKELRHKYLDFGSHFHFTSHIGVRLLLGGHVELGYRFQHMSNAGIGERNPGRNLHMFSISARF